MGPDCQLLQYETSTPDTNTCLRTCLRYYRSQSSLTLVARNEDGLSGKWHTEGDAVDGPCRRMGIAAAELQLAVSGPIATIERGM